MDVAQAADQKLVRLVVTADPQAGVLLGQPGQSSRNLFLIAPRLGEDRNSVCRVGDRKLRARAVGRAEQVTGQRLLKLGDPPDVPDADVLGVQVLFSAGKEELPEALVATPR